MVSVMSRCTLLFLCMCQLNLRLLLSNDFSSESSSSILFCRFGMHSVQLMYFNEFVSAQEDANTEK